MKQVRCLYIAYIRADVDIVSVVDVLQHAVRKLSMSRPSGDDAAQLAFNNEAFNAEQLAFNSNRLDEEQHTCNKSSFMILVDRPIYTQDKFHETFQISPDYRNGKPTTEVLRNLWHRQCYPPASKECMKLTCFSFLPFLRIMKEYNVRHNLLSDILAGLTVSFMHIPQGKRLLQIALHVSQSSLYYCLNALNVDVDELVLSNPLHRLEN